MNSYFVSIYMAGVFEYLLYEEYYILVKEQ